MCPAALRVILATLVSCDTPRQAKTAIYLQLSGDTRFLSLEVEAQAQAWPSTLPWRSTRVPTSIVRLRLRALGLPAVRLNSACPRVFPPGITAWGAHRSMSIMARPTVATIPPSGSVPPMASVPLSPVARRSPLTRLCVTRLPGMPSVTVTLLRPDPRRFRPVSPRNVDYRRFDYCPDALVERGYR